MITQLIRTTILLISLWTSLPTMNHDYPPASPPVPPPSTVLRPGEPPLSQAPASPGPSDAEALRRAAENGDPVAAAAGRDLGPRSSDAQENREMLRWPPCNGKNGHWMVELMVDWWVWWLDWWLNWWLVGRWGPRELRSWLMLSDGLYHGWLMVDGKLVIIFSVLSRFAGMDRLIHLMFTMDQSTIGSGGC